jgi:hypothetical protein
MIKEIKTEKFSGLAVLVPDETTNHELRYVKYSDGKEYYSLNYQFGRNSSYTHGGFLLWYKDFGGRKNYPKEGELHIIGIATQLTEEQCTEIVSLFSSPYLGGKKYVSYHNMNLYESAKDSFASLMQSLGCYSVNPYTHPSKLSPIGYNKNKQKWQEAQANTGTWLIIQKI